MKLTKVHIKEYQSIRDSNEFKINDITCLVGKNEAGKTALLQALYKLNPIIDSDSKYDITDDYPRMDVEDYQQDIDADRRKHAVVCQATFELDDELNDLFSDYSNKVLKNKELVLSKGYENILYFSINVNVPIVIKEFIEEAQLPEDLKKEFVNVNSLQELENKITELSNPQTEEHLKRLREKITSLSKYDNDLTKFIYQNYIKTYVPKFLYFDEYYQMRGHENLEKLKERIRTGKLEKSDYPLLGLIELARLDIDDLLNPARTQWLINKLEGAGNHLSKKVLNYWSQNEHLDIDFDVRPGRPGDPEGMQNGNNLWAQIRDSKHKVKTLLGSRSRGFVWFFSFLAWFDQQQRKKEPLILLLDEPGLFLHGKAQEDLLIFLEKELKGNHQVIYTTHSPFMVDPKKFERIRIVQDKSMDSKTDLPKEEDGTKVFTEVFEATQDSLFPLQGALGYEIQQTLFVGPYNLIVEGVSDLIFLETLSELLKELGRTGLDKWIITPVGGADKVPTFVSLLSSQKKLKVATLIDFSKNHQQMIENLYKKKILHKQNVLTFSDFNSGIESDIEDMFDIDFYLDMVNEEYKSNLSTKLVKSKLDNNLPRVIQKVEIFLKDNPLKNKISFSHYRPAKYFATNISNLKSKISDATLTKFEEIFKTLNKLL